MTTDPSATDPSAPLDGVVVIDKPAGCTSHDVVARARKALGTRRVGHAGTLDPMATGVLILGVGRATRLLTFVVGVDKTYRATIRLGESTDTDDAEGTVLAQACAAGLEPTVIATEIARLTGPIAQVPSTVSAKKIAGQRAYDLVRAGAEVVLPPREVTVRRFEVLAQRPGQRWDLDVEVEVTSGTYVRALARDLGAALGVGGHLTALRRSAVGPFSLADSVPLAEFVDAPRLWSPAAAARRIFPARELTASEVAALRFGQRIAASADPVSPLAGFGPDGELVALLANIVGPGDPTQARSILVLPPHE